MTGTFLLYGATGYTGRLAARTAAQQGMKPILAGRNPAKVEALGRELGLEWVAFALDDRNSMDAALRRAPVVLNCAGPYSQTYPPMVEACLRTHTHYLDITGELPEHEALAARDDEAQAAGVMLLPSVGFDVVPSDCLAAHLKRRLPAATRLTLAFNSQGGWSRGTAITGTDMIDRTGMVRAVGVLVKVPAGWKTQQVDFGAGPVSCILMSWGDLATAYRSTGVPNIETYHAFPAAMQLGLKSLNALGPLLARPLGQKLLAAAVAQMPEGPDEKALAEGYAQLWGEMTDTAGKRVVSRMRTPHAYKLTALAALLIVRRVLDGDVHRGYQTPAKAYGPELVMEIPGVTREDVE